MGSKTQPYAGYSETPIHNGKVYVAGPMRGIEDFNFPAFDAAAAELRRAGGYFVFNPAERDREVHGDRLKSETGDLAELDSIGFSLREALGADLAWITANADIVVVLDGWENSKGARAEVATAEALGLEVTTVSGLVWGDPQAEDIISANALPPERLVRTPREQVLKGATDAVTGDRNNQYGPPTQDFERTSGMANAWGFRIGGDGELLKAHHTAIFMDFLKASRKYWNPGKFDNWMDGAGYEACGWECVVEEGLANND